MTKTPDFFQPGTAAGPPPLAEVLFASANFSLYDLLHKRAADIVKHAKSVGYAGVAHMIMRPWLQNASGDILKEEVPGISLLQEPWQLNPKWISVKSLKANARFRLAMPSTHLGPFFPGASYIAKAREHNPVPVTMYLDPSGSVERDRRKIDMLGGPANVSVRITARFMEIAGADSAAGILDTLGERSIGGVFDLFESNSNSPKTGRPPAVVPSDWLQPVYEQGLLDGIGFSAYRVDQNRPDPDLVNKSNIEMDELLFDGRLSGAVGDQISVLQEFAVPRVVVNLPFEGAVQALNRSGGKDHYGAVAIRGTTDLYEAAATTIYNLGIGNAIRPH